MPSAITTKSRKGKQQRGKQKRQHDDNEAPKTNRKLKSNLVFQAGSDRGGGRGAVQADKHDDNPPRPLASRRVDPLNQFQTLQSSQTSKQAPGGGFTLPLPPPNRPGSLGQSSSVECSCPFRPLQNQHFRFLAPPSPHIYALYLPSDALT